jgi:hypothetical protein
MKDIVPVNPTIMNKFALYKKDLPFLNAFENRADLR